jgi:hypothetical protein
MEVMKPRRGPEGGFWKGIFLLSEIPHEEKEEQGAGQKGDEKGEENVEHRGGIMDEPVLVDSEENDSGVYRGRHEVDGVSAQGFVQLTATPPMMVTAP